jgi:hypothetical protein
MEHLDLSAQDKHDEFRGPIYPAVANSRRNPALAAVRLFSCKPAYLQTCTRHADITETWCAKRGDEPPKFPKSQSERLPALANHQPACRILGICVIASNRKLRSALPSNRPSRIRLGPSYIVSCRHVDSSVLSCTRAPAAHWTNPTTGAQFPSTSFTLIPRHEERQASQWLHLIR